MAKARKAQSHILSLTADIVGAYVSGNSVEAEAMPAFIRSVHATLSELAALPDQSEPVELIPAVPIAESITDDFIICLEDGLPFKSLRRHLRTKFDLSPETYRQKWGLPHDYPMVAASYAAQRSKLAKKMGLGKSERR